MSDWYATPPAMPGWDTDWESGDLWWWAMWDHRVYNMFVNAYIERANCLVDSTGFAISGNFASADDDMMAKWNGIYSSVAAMASNMWLDPSVDLTGGFSADGSDTSVPDLRNYVAGGFTGLTWVPTPMPPLQYPREILTLSDPGTDGWRARFVGHAVSGAVTGKIYVRTAGVWVQEPDATSTGIPDIVSGPTFPSGWTDTAPYFTGSILNGMKAYLHQFSATVQNFPGPDQFGAAVWWKVGQHNFASASTKSAAEAIFAGGTGVNTPLSGVPANIAATQHAGPTYTLEAQDAHLHMDEISAPGLTREMQAYVRGDAEADFDGTPHFDAGPTGLTNLHCGQMGSTITASAAPVDFGQFGNHTIQPAWPPGDAGLPASTLVVTRNGAVPDAGTGIYLLQYFTFKYVPGYSGT